MNKDLIKLLEAHPLYAESPYKEGPLRWIAEMAPHIPELIELANGWISVEDRLPEVEQFVDILASWEGRDGKTYYRRFTDVEYYPEMKFPWIHDDFPPHIDSGMKVISWMPRPAVPLDGHLTTPLDGPKL